MIKKHTTGIAVSSCNGVLEPKGSVCRNTSRTRTFFLELMQWAICRLRGEQSLFVWDASCTVMAGFKWQARIRMCVCIIDVKVCRNVTICNTQADVKAWYISVSIISCEFDGWCWLLSGP